MMLTQTSCHLTSAGVTSLFLLLHILTKLLIISACKCVVYQSSGYSRGIFTSPNFPEIYSPGINCVLYTFMGELGEIVELTFLHFDLQMRYGNNK